LLLDTFEKENMAVEINSDIKAELACLVEGNIGNSIEFSNGCCLSIKDNNGMF
jgi:hypothetical protein